MAITERGKVFITATFNNTLVTITNNNGDAVAWGSSGSAGFKVQGNQLLSRRQLRLKAVKVNRKGIKTVEVFVKVPAQAETLL